MIDGADCECSSCRVNARVAHEALSRVLGVRANETERPAEVSAAGKSQEPRPSPTPRPTLQAIYDWIEHRAGEALSGRDRLDLCRLLRLDYAGFRGAEVRHAAE